MANRSRRRTPWIIAGLIVFVVADLALVAFALNGPALDGNSVNAVEPTFVPTPEPTFSATPSAAPTTTPVPTSTAAPTQTPTATSTTPATAPTTAAASLTGMADAKVGYRATPGTCTGESTSTDSVIELTTDGGATWTNVNPTDLRIRMVEKIVVVDASHVDLLAKYGASCRESAVSTFTQGEFWQAYPDRTAALK